MAVSIISAGYHVHRSADRMGVGECGPSLKRALPLPPPFLSGNGFPGVYVPGPYNSDFRCELSFRPAPVVEAALAVSLPVPPREAVPAPVVIPLLFVLQQVELRMGVLVFLWLSGLSLHDNASIQYVVFPDKSCPDIAVFIREADRCLRVGDPVRFFV